MNGRKGADAPQLPSVFIPHGGGPCFFMEWTMGPRDTWDRLAQFLRSFPERVGVRPDSIAWLKHCTFALEDRFFSCRRAARDGHAGQFGGQCGVIALTG